MKAHLFVENQASWVEFPRFAYPRATAHDWDLRRRYLAIYMDDDPAEPALIGLGIAIPKNATGTFERTIEVEDFFMVSPVRPLKVVASHLKNFADALSGDGPLTPARGRRLVEAISEQFPDLADRIDRLRHAAGVGVNDEAGAEIDMNQRDASNVLLLAFDMDRSMIRDWPRPSPEEDFYSRIPGDALVPHEDDLIRHDWMHMPGWSEGEGVSWTGRRHVSGDRVLHIWYGNGRQLERQTGVDLVYYNSWSGAFVLVQYKKLARADGGLTYWPDSDKNFAGELERMKAIDDASGFGEDSSDLRMMDSATFFKFCEPARFEPGSQDLIPGMYLSRTHTESILSHGQALKQRGRRLGIKVVPRYMNNTLFTGLLGDGWIGTRGLGTDTVYAQAAISIDLGRALVIGLANERIGNGLAR